MSSAVRKRVALFNWSWRSFLHCDEDAKMSLSAHNILLRYGRSVRISNMNYGSAQTVAPAKVSFASKTSLQRGDRRMKFIPLPVVCLRRPRKREFMIWGIFCHRDWAISVPFRFQLALMGWPQAMGTITRATGRILVNGHHLKRAGNRFFFFRCVQWPSGRQRHT